MSYYCSKCGEECEVEAGDDGIGPYEYWGDKGVHHDYYVESVCCGAGIKDANGYWVRYDEFIESRELWDTF